MPIVRRLPKRGFHSLFRTSYRIINVGALGDFGDGAQRRSGERSRRAA